MRHLRSALWERIARRAEVPIDRCYHYRAFRYGGFGSNPYEDYQVGLVRGQDVKVLRNAFADVILNCRPRTMGEAIGIDLPDWPAWRFPWKRNPRRTIKAIEIPENNPDVVCHHCDAGILASHINREFQWLEMSIQSIRERGYKPCSYGYIQCIELSNGHCSSFLVVDGNHRLAALHALGNRTAEIMIWPSPVRREDVDRWPDVRNGVRPREQALRLFDRYFSETNRPLPTKNPARLIVDEHPMWL